jgi:hypothetical protein
MIMTAPSRMAALFARAYGLLTKPAPLDLPETQTQLVWNARFDGRAEQRWMRDLIVEVSKELPPEPAGEARAEQRRRAPRAQAR